MVRRFHGVEGVHGVRGVTFFRAPQGLPTLERDLFISITRPRLLPSVVVSPLRGLSLPPNLDRRLYHPLGRVRPALSISGTPHRLTLPRGSARGAFLTPAVAFGHPHRVAICVRRKRRKEVIFALGRAGRGGSFRKPRRNFYSSVECR